MQRSKTRLELLGTTYLNISEIKRLLDIPQLQAKKIYNIAMEQDKQQLGARQIYDTKVRLKTVIDVAGMTYSMLAKQIKSATPDQEPALR